MTKQELIDALGQDSLDSRVVALDYDGDPLEITEVVTAFSGEIVLRTEFGEVGSFQLDADDEDEDDALDETQPIRRSMDQDV